MQFWCVKEFKFKEGDRVIAHYAPGLSYQCRPGNDRLKALLLGGVLPGGNAVCIERDMRLTEIKPGEKVTGWLADGLMTLVPPEGAVAGGGSVSGTATTDDGEG